jgi:hypothetical protein
VPFLLVHAVPGARFAKPSALRFRTMLVRRGQRGRLPLVPGDEHDDPCLGSDAALSTIAAFFREHLA